MRIESLPLDLLHVNRSNDRHGELENETAAIGWLFNHLESHMRNLAADVTKSGRLFEPPLVTRLEDRWIVYDGNRRVTCLKLLGAPRRAPTVELQEFFAELRKSWPGKFPDEIQCQIEDDKDEIDEILYRRHTGTQGGIGQTTWDDRMKANFISRTGRDGSVNVAEKIEALLTESGTLPRRKIPRSNLNRLLSSDKLRRRIGFTVSRGELKFTHQAPLVLHAMHRIASDLSEGKLTLDQIWNNADKHDYLDKLAHQRALPTQDHLLTGEEEAPRRGSKPSAALRPSSTPRPQQRDTLIPAKDFSIVWPGELQRIHAIWEELQFRLSLAEHPNAISVLFRVLLELSIEHYLSTTPDPIVKANDKLGTRALKVAEHLYAKGKINKKDMDTFKKFTQFDALVSADTLNRYVHSKNFAPSPEHLTAIWDSLAAFVVMCIKTTK